MPLSEHEERVFAELERQLTSQDDDDAVSSTPRPPSPRAQNRRGLAIAVVGMVVGLVCMLALTAHIAFGMVGFVLLLVSTTAAVRRLQERHRIRQFTQGDRSSSRRPSN